MPYLHTQNLTFSSIQPLEQHLVVLFNLFSSEIRFRCIRAARDVKADKAVLCEQKEGNAGRHDQSLEDTEVNN